MSEPTPRERWRRQHNVRMVGKLAVLVLMMFGFGYAMVPLYRTICSALGVNVLAVTEDTASSDGVANSQVDRSRTITVEFDANAHGLWAFRPEQSSVKVHPGEMTTVMYDFRNTQDRTMTAQAIPSYAPKDATSHFHKLQCFCFTQHTLAPGESKRWPVVFVIDPKLPRSVTTITLSYTFFEVGGKMPAAPTARAQPQPAASVWELG